MVVCQAVVLLGSFWCIQVSSGWGQSSPQEAGAAGHGPTTQTLAVQTPRQPLPHQDGEGPAGAGLAHDTGAGTEVEVTGRNRWRRFSRESKWAWVFNRVRFCAGVQLVRQCPAKAEEHSETAGPELGAEDQTVQQLHPGERWATERVQRRHRHRRYQLRIKTFPTEATRLCIFLWIVLFSTRWIESRFGFLRRRWRVPLTDTHQPIRVRQVVSQERPAEARRRSRHGRLGQQRRRRVASVQVQEQFAEPLPERHAAPHDGGRGRRRRLRTQEEEPLWVAQLRGVRPGCRLAGVVVRNRGQLCPSEGWEMSLIFLK